MTLTALLLVLYAGALVGLSVRRRAAGATAVDWLLDGRRLTLPAFVATLVTTWYGGILGVGEYSWRHGLANWLVFGVPYYVGALLFAFLFAKRAREARLYTLPDLLDRPSPRALPLFTVLLEIQAARTACSGRIFVRSAALRAVHLRLPLPSSPGLCRHTQW